MVDELKVVLPCSSQAKEAELLLETILIEPSEL